MKKWFMSLNGAVVLSVLAWLTFLAFNFLYALFVAGEMGLREDQPVKAAQFIAGSLAVFGGWVWALLASVRGSRGGMIVALIFSLLSTFLAGFALLVWCAGKGCAAWPVGNIIVWAELVTGLIATVALVLQLGQISKR